MSGFVNLITNGTGPCLISDPNGPYPIKKDDGDDVDDDHDHEGDGGDDCCDDDDVGDDMMI